MRCHTSFSGPPCKCTDVIRSSGAPVVKTIDFLPGQSDWISAAVMYINYYMVASLRASGLRWSR